MVRVLMCKHSVGRGMVSLGVTFWMLDTQTLKARLALVWADTTAYTTTAF